MIPMRCDYCRKEFEAWPYQVRNGRRFCSRSCKARLLLDPRVGAKATAEKHQATAIQRFWERVARMGPEDCWEWQGYRNPSGYGQTSWNGKLSLAHRIAQSLTDGEWSNRLHVCHTCDNPPCCNPAHLWRGTDLANQRDMIRKGRERHVAPLGEAHGMSRLTAEDVTDIRASDLSSHQLAEKYCVTHGHINQIRSRLQWRHVP